MTENFYVGVDVGTGSVRASLVRENGEIVKIAVNPIKTWNPQKDFYEQSSDDIWKACCKGVKTVVGSINCSYVKGIGFDATCSLVCIGNNNSPLTISPTGNDNQNVILWMDHRAQEQADFINFHKPEILKYVGGKISLEMQTPKLMWLKQNLKNTWNKAKYFFDLADFLTWKATDDDSRSLCTVVCKWTFLAGINESFGWDKEYFSLIGLNDLGVDNFSKIGTKVKAPGENCGLGLTVSAANELGLLPGTCVGAGLIDAHAGALGLLTASVLGINSSFESKISLICGTSSCHMILSETPKTVPGVWGPYFSALVPEMYVHEAGQSASGKLLDFILESHPAFPFLNKRFGDKLQVQKYLNDLLQKMAKGKNLSSCSTLTSKIHIWPDFHGNRSPLADSSLLGMISGLTLSSDEEDLALKYLAGIQALAYGTRHILDTLYAHGYNQISTVFMGGGLSKNLLFVQVHADVLGLPVVLPKVAEPVLLGAAILGAVAAGAFKSIKKAVTSLKGPADVFAPNESEKEYHLKKYKIFLKLVEDQKSYNDIMQS